MHNENHIAQVNSMIVYIVSEISHFSPLNYTRAGSAAPDYTRAGLAASKDASLSEIYAHIHFTDDILCV